MARRRFFVSEIRNRQAAITGDEARHLSQVLRVEAGQVFEISDNREVWLAEVETARKAEIVFRILDQVEVAPELYQTHLYVALIKFDRFETVLEKATELGVTTITPVETVRGERGLERAASKRYDRWRRIAHEASQQSRRARLPELCQVVALPRALEQAAARRFFLDEARRGRPLLAALADPAAGDTVALLVGPEGGWTDAERAQAGAAGWLDVTLGETVLRTETACLAALAVIAAAYETLRPAAPPG
ncbi:MAG: 16S rRNA (uracil(1498)-N(3))-methyltransferase [Acidobacteria bacterium]|nr:16S rRNA (uracil(1498)-N(3))-methyltransferase [Acidobacteriota bacterium]